MTNYTVEVTTAPPKDGDWSALRRVLDIVPGSLLVEDTDEPVLIIPVDAEAPLKAAMFVDGIAKLTDLELVTGKVYPTPEIDFEIDDDEPAENTEAVKAVQSWMSDVPPLTGHINQEGRLVGSGS